MPRFGLDYSFSAPITPAEHKSVGSSFAVRYLNGSHPKALTKTEAAQLHGGQISICVVYESTAKRALSGRAAGVADAQAALNTAHALGIPGDRPIYFAVDFDATPGQQVAINDYFRGIHEVFDNAGPASFPTGVPVGAYAGYWPLKRLFDAGLIDYGWQTLAWSGGNVDKRACLYQFSINHGVAGHAVDYNRQLKDDFGQWPFRAPKPPAPKKPRGVWHFEGYVDMDHDTAHIHGTPGKNVHMGDVATRKHFSVSVDEKHGDWQIHKAAS